MKPISDELLKAYFLGKLPAAEAEILEIECASNEESSQQAQVVERELTDDYLRGNLTAADRRLFRKNYLVTEARQHRLSAAEGLWKIAAKPSRDAVPVAQTSAVSGWQTLFGWRKAFQFGFAGLILLLGIGALAFYLLNSATPNQNEIASIKESNQPPEIETPQAPKTDEQQAVQNPETVNQNTENVPNNSVVQQKETNREANPTTKNAPEMKTAPAPKITKPNSISIASFVLFADGLRDGEKEQFITIGQNVKILNLLLSPQGKLENYRIFRASVRTPEDETVYTSPELAALSFKIAAEKLENRTYIISLEGKNKQNEFEPVADYVFRVRR